MIKRLAFFHAFAIFQVEKLQNGKRRAEIMKLHNFRFFFFERAQQAKELYGYYALTIGDPTLFLSGAAILHFICTCSLNERVRCVQIKHSIAPAVLHH